MSGVAVIGEESRIRGYAMVGAAVVPAEGATAVRAAWRALPAEVGLVLLTAAAARDLSEHDREGVWPLVVVMD